jgi:transcriptional regulator with XRE-family HTH domain
MDLIALGALIHAKRGQAKITQETLALDVFGDSTRKGDISRIENGKVTPQEATLQKLCDALSISEAEMLPIRTARRADEQLANIPSLSREELQNLSARFGLENAFTADDTELRRQLTIMADEFRTLKKLVIQMNNQLNENNKNVEELEKDKLAVNIPFRGQIACGVPIASIYHDWTEVKIDWITHRYGEQSKSSTKRPFYIATPIDLLEEAIDQLEWKRAHFLLSAAQNFVAHQINRTSSFSH